MPKAQPAKKGRTSTRGQQKETVDTPQPEVSKDKPEPELAAAEEKSTEPAPETKGKQTKRVPRPKVGT